MTDAVMFRFDRVSSYLRKGEEQEEGKYVMMVAELVYVN